ncbi:hypothetical protein V6U77_08990 [Micromonospora sp. CPCC 205546]|uniref:phthiocerol/phthiodiolone dimycocerosyl transferase family protein n=1 Tax=Micromonospora sp. CPCC 205546 TaxID=3122397 RepID=UPI002FEF3109
MTGEVRRPLSPMERWYWVCDQVSPLNVVARVRVAGAYPEEDLVRAGASLAREHPLLRVAIAAGPDGADPCFVPARQAGIPVRTVRADPADGRRWEREVDDVELATPVDWRSGPLARIVDVGHAVGTDQEHHDLVLTASHVIADGTTALELLRRLVELTAGGAPRPRRPLPAPEALLPRRVAGLPRAAHLVAAVLADGAVTAVARPRRLTPQTPVPVDRRRSRLLRRELTADQLDALVSRCSREGVTVHTALAAAMAAGVAEVASPGWTGRICVGSPVDFRTELHPPVTREDAGAYVATVPSYVRVGPSVDLWTAARGASRDLRRRRRWRQHLALVSLLRRMSPPSVARSARAVAVVDRMGPGNVCLSNLGRVDLPDRVGGWGLSGAQFVAGISVSGQVVAAVNTSHGKLHWNFTYIDGAVSPERAGQIADAAVRALLSGLHDATPAGTATKG